MFFIKLCIIPFMLFVMYFVQYLIYLLYSIFGLNNLDNDTDNLNLYKGFKLNISYMTFLLLPVVFWVENLSLLKCFQLFLINVCIVYILMLIFKSKKINCNELINTENSSIKIELLYNTNKDLSISGLTIIEGIKDNEIYERFLNRRHLDEHSSNISDIINKNNVMYSVYGNFFYNFDEAFLYLMNVSLKNRNKRELLKTEFKNLYSKFNPSEDFFVKFDFTEQLITINNNLN